MPSSSTRDRSHSHSPIHLPLPSISLPPPTSLYLTPRSIPWYQVCSAGSRLLVQENVAQTVVKKIKNRMTHLRVGDSLDKVEYNLIIPYN